MLCYPFNTDIIVCRKNNISIFEYNVVNYDTFELQHKETFNLGSNVKYYGDCSGICLFNDNDNDNDDYEFKISNDESIVMNKQQQRKYQIVLFGGYKSIDNYKWLSLTINNINNNNQFIFQIDKNKTDKFQNTLHDKIKNNDYRYYSFGYTKWKHYLILFGGRVGGSINAEVNLIFYFNFIEMKWYKSKEV